MEKLIFFVIVCVVAGIAGWPVPDDEVRLRPTVKYEPFGTFAPPTTVVSMIRPKKINRNVHKTLKDLLDETNGRKMELKRLKLSHDTLGQVLRDLQATVMRLSDRHGLYLI